MSVTVYLRDGRNVILNDASRVDAQGRNFGGLHLAVPHHVLNCLTDDGRIVAQFHNETVLGYEVYPPSPVAGQ